MNTIFETIHKDIQNSTDTHLIRLLFLVQHSQIKVTLPKCYYYGLYCVQYLSLRIVAQLDTNWACRRPGIPVGLHQQDSQGEALNRPDNRASTNHDGYAASSFLYRF